MAHTFPIRPRRFQYGFGADSNRRKFTAGNARGGRRAPRGIEHHVRFSSDPDGVVDFYRRTLQVI